MPLWRLLAGLAIVMAYAVASHWMMSYHPNAPWSLLVLLGPLLLAILGFATQRWGRWGGLPVAAAALALVVGVARGEPDDANRLYLLQHVGINMLLGGWFGLSLQRRPLTLIGQLAQRLHRQLTPDMVSYTAKVTAVWAAYFLLVAALSVGVYATQPFTTWSFASNVLAPISIAALFIGEHVVRYLLHPEFERVRMVDAVRAFRAGADVPATPR